MASHHETHALERAGWLRAAVLGANDGLVSTASLVIGVASAGSEGSEILVAGLAGLTAGAMSMAAGEFVSVSSQADAERADVELERQELASAPEAELQELIDIYVARGLDPELARPVAEQLMAHDPLGSHLRDELGIAERSSARPLQAAVVSALTFVTGAALPVVVAAATPSAHILESVTVTTLLGLFALGALGAWVGGAPIGRGALRVGAWGALAMAITAAVGAWFGVSA